MKTAATVLLLCLTPGFTARSQTTSKDTAVVLSADQLRTTALIFAEHAFLQRENVLLNGQISALQQSLAESGRMIADYRTAILALEANRTDADRLQQSIADAYREQLKQQRKKTRRRTILCAAGGVAAGIVIGIAGK